MGYMMFCVAFTMRSVCDVCDDMSVIRCAKFDTKN